MPLYIFSYTIKRKQRQCVFYRQYYFQMRLTYFVYDTAIVTLLL